MNRKCCTVTCLAAFSTAVVAALGMPAPNSPPSPINFPPGYQVDVIACPGGTLDITPGFSDPNGNYVTLTVNDNNNAVPNGLSIATNNGNPATARLVWSPTREAVGSYQLSFRAVDNAGGNNTTNVTLTVNVTCPCNPPAASSQPAPATSLCEGQNFSVTVVASGDQPMRYQWNKDGVDIVGATADTFAINGVVPSDAGEYSCGLNNNCYSERSASARLVVDSPPTVIANPDGVVACPNDAVTFTADASGTAPIAFQWTKDGIDIPGATDRTLTLPGAVATDAGVYGCRATNHCGVANTTVAGLTVLEDTHFTMHPVSRTTCEGGAITLNSVVTGTEPVTFQWVHDGQAIAGANGTTFDIPAASPSDSGDYALVATNGCGSTTSRVASVTVDTVPTISTDLQSMVSCPGTTATFRVTATQAGTAELTFSWFKNGSELSSVHGDTLTLPGVTTADAGDYSVTVSNSCGETSSSVASLSVLENAGIIGQPSSQSACQGGSVTFNVGVGGTAPITYQWQKNGVSIAGAIGPSLTINPVRSSDAGIYRCWVTNQCNTVMSANAALILDAGPTFSEQPQNQTVCPGETANFSARASSSGMISYQWRKDGSNIVGATSRTLTIPGVTAGDVGSYSVEVTNHCGQALSNPASLALNSGNFTITQHPLSADLCSGNSLALSIAAIGNPMPTFQWRKNGVSIVGATGDSFAIPNVVVEDSGTYDVEVTAGTSCGSIISDAAAVVVWPTGSADINGDGAVNGLDISEFVQAMLRHNSVPGGADLAGCGADMNANGSIDVGDLSGFLTNVLGNG